MMSFSPANRLATANPLAAFRWRWRLSPLLTRPCRNSKNNKCHSEPQAKNLALPATYESEILRLSPQDDITIRSLRGGEGGAIKPKRHSVCVSEGEGDTAMDHLICPALVPVEMPVGLTHLDSDLCWCDPSVEVDDDGEHILLHRQVTWN